MLVLSAIGVIAALTIPGIMQNMNNRQAVTTLKKTYSDISQATTQVLTDNDGSIKGAFYPSVRDQYLKYLRYLKACSISRDEGCWHTDGVAKWLNNTPAPNWGGAQGLILSNGAFVVFSTDDPNCQKNYGSVYVCGYMAVDINGFKGPNIVARDIFRIWIQEYGIKPFGIPGDSQSCSPNGDGCTAKVLTENAINY